MAEKQENQMTNKKKIRIIPLLAVVAMVLAVAALSTMEDGRHFAALRRYLMYGSTSETDNLFTFPAGQSNRYGLLGNQLLVVNENSIRLLQDDGTEAYNLPVPTLSMPQLTVGRNLAAVCDVGGNTLYLLDSTGIIKTFSTEEGYSYYKARMNLADYLTVVEQKSGYKACLSVYDGSGKLVFEFYSSKHYLYDGLVTEDGRYVVAVGPATAQDGIFSSQMLMFDLVSEEEVGNCLIRDGLVLDFFADKERAVSLCDKRLTMTALTGETLLDVPYGNLYLHDGSLTGDHFCALLLGRYQAGNVCTLTTYTMEGTEIASLNLTEEILDISAAGDYLAVLYSNSLTIYNKDLTEYATLDGTDYAGEVQMQSDGTALLIAASSAWKFLP